MKALHFMLAAALLGGCGDDSDPAAPDLDVRGNYAMAELTFDPQGSLPGVDLRARISRNVPRLVLATDGRAQLVFEDPATGLVTTANASYTIAEPNRVSVSFDEASTMYRGSFLSRRMTFTYDPSQRTLVFAGASPDGVDRQRLLAAVPEWAQEQLFDPVPGTLQVIFRASASSTP